MKLKDQTTGITGASSGGGEGMATAFHRDGAHLSLSARRQTELERVKALCTTGPGRVQVLPFDRVDASQREAAARTVLADARGWISSSTTPVSASVRQRKTPCRLSTGVQY